MKRKQSLDHKEKNNEMVEPPPKRGFWAALTRPFTEQPDEIPEVTINGFMIEIRTSDSETFLPARNVLWVRNDISGGKQTTAVAIKDTGIIRLNGHHAKQIMSIWFGD